MMHGRSALIASLGAALLASASPAAAAPLRPIGPQTTSWSITEITQGTGNNVLGHDTTTASRVRKRFDIGHQGFAFRDPNFSENADPQVQSDTGAWFTLARAPSLDRLHPQGSPKGSAAHLKIKRVFEKDARNASMHVLVNELLLELVDANGPLSQFECPVVGTAPCPSLRSEVDVRLRAWSLAGGPPLVDLGGAVYVEGHEHAWLPEVATDSRSRGAFWEGARFQVNRDKEGDGRQDHAEVFSGESTPIAIPVPLRSLKNGERFAVQVTLDPKAIDERGGESAVQAAVDAAELDNRQGGATDPGHAAAVLSVRGLEAVRAPRLKEPPVRRQPLAHCPGGRRRHAGRVQLSGAAFSVGEASGTAMVLVARRGGSRGAATVTLGTSGGSAGSGRDFKRTRTRVRFENGDTSPRLVEIPIREDLTRESPERFTVSLAHARCAKLGKRRKASVTILDDDQPPPPPPPVFTIGGTVDGLQGSGLVLTNLGQELSVSADGSFTLPGTHTTNELYDVSVTSQPRNPDQLCTVQNGKGHVGSVNITNLAVHCATVAPPSGLDPTFGGDGRVTTPGGGDARAVLIQPDGHIVAVGRRPVGVIGHFQFGAVRYDTAGNLDHSFGSDGIATTSLGGSVDEANDAALLSDGGFVAVGDTDVNGVTNADFAVARYTPDGQPAPGFGSNGFVTTDLAGRGDVATAVAVQPDGKIVAAGYAETSLRVFDFAIARYNPDGTLDRSFGRNGIVTTDLGTEDDRTNDIALQPDGKIVAVGPTELGAGLVRYQPDGTLDLTFGDGDGKVVSDIDTNVINGVALTPGGTILLAGTRGGDVIVASYAPNGRLNLGFGQAGVVQADIGGQFDSGEDLVLDSLGDIVVVGSATSATVYDTALIRFRPNGTIVRSLAADLGDGFGDVGYALAIDSQGRIVAAGTAFGLMRAFL